jgi:hypothetical protein
MLGKYIHIIYSFYYSESPFVVLDNFELDKSYGGVCIVRGKIRIDGYSNK